MSFEDIDIFVKGREYNVLPETGMNFEYFGKTKNGDYEFHPVSPHGLINRMVDFLVNEHTKIIPLIIRKGTFISDGYTIKSLVGNERDFYIVGSLESKAHK